MTQYNTLNVKLSNSQLNKWISGIKKIVLKVSSIVVGNSNDENNFLHKFLLTNTQVSRLRKAFANSSSANIKLWKTQLHRIWQSRGFLGLLRPLLKTRSPLVGNILKPLAKSVLIPLGLTAAAAAAATDAAIHNKMFVSGNTALINSIAEMNDIMKIFKAFQEFWWLIKGNSETVKNEAKEQKRGFILILWSTLGTNLLGNLLRASEGTIRVEQYF